MTLIAACASLPPPTAELDTAQQALARAEAADADQYAADALAAARSALQAAQVASARGRNDEARDGALAAAAEADLAWVRSSAAKVRADWRQKQDELTRLRRQLQMPVEAGAADVPLDIPVPAGTPEQRLQALDADIRLNPFAQYERLQARQALAALATVSRKALPAALARAQQRVEIAELAARVEAARRALDRMERERSELLVEASRRDAERARAEAERLRIQAQLQAEEAERLRAQAQQAEAALDGAQAEQQAKAEAARAQEAALARKEAELVAGAKLPPMQRDARGEVYTLAGDAFAPGQAKLTPAAAASLKALGLYLAALPGGPVQVIGYTDNQGDAAANRSLSERRAQQVRAALVAAGVERARVTAQGRGAEAPVADNRTAAGRAKNRRVEVVVAQKS
ncbi:OmpA family protein [Thermomonas alba]|uniref:OmpA family protein n=1 Tax=Thermomonas alba TaxID=2888525 RepID=UPI0030B7FCBC